MLTLEQNKWGNGGHKQFYGKLSEIEKRTSSDFIRIHKSYLVNKHYISEYNYGSIKLLNGQVLSITRIYRSEIRKMLMREGV
ncbi:LytTR family DNA-binding domain-containing protein [Aminipila luticellarii]|uniref:LytTR family transcriptional regulator n=1 Tax=Aminipila luticellarii TaxID=2507160 RepID=A0A410PY79_9FIRM|nr:LytTR family transcriptional regulator [Aminipila luticellarii]